MASHLNLLRLALASALGKAFAVWVLCVPTVALAQTNASDTQSSLQAVGRVLGMMLFGFLLMRWINRRKENRASTPKTGLRSPVKPLYMALVLVLGLALLMWVSG